MRCGNWVSLKFVIVSRKCGISENVKEYVISAGPPRSPATKVNYSRLFAPSERWRKIIKKAPGVFHQTRTSWNRACKQEQLLSISKVIIYKIFQSHQSLHHHIEKCQVEKMMTFIEKYAKIYEGFWGSRQSIKYSDKLHCWANIPEVKPPFVEKGESVEHGLGLKRFLFSVIEKLQENCENLL